MSKAKSIVKFNQEIKHGRLRFPANTVVEFEDGDAGEYFCKAGWAEKASGKAQVSVSADELDIDPNTVMGTGPNAGLKVKDITTGSGN